MAVERGAAAVRAALQQQRQWYQGSELVGWGEEAL